MNPFKGEFKEQKHIWAIRNAEMNVLIYASLACSWDSLEVERSGREMDLIVPL